MYNQSIQSLRVSLVKMDHDSSTYMYIATLQHRVQNIALQLQRVYVDGSLFHQSIMYRPEVRP